MAGNLLVERMVGAHIHQVSVAEYTRTGSSALGTCLAAQLTAKVGRLMPGGWGIAQGLMAKMLTSVRGLRGCRLPLPSLSVNVVGGHYRDDYEYAALFLSVPHAEACTAERSCCDDAPPIGQHTVKLFSALVFA